MTYSVFSETLNPIKSVNYAVSEVKKQTYSILFLICTAYEICCAASATYFDAVLNGALCCSAASVVLVIY